MSETMEPLEAEYRNLIPWVVAETPIRLPPSLRRADGWLWDAEDEQLIGLADGGEYCLHVELTIGRTRVNIAVLSVIDDDGLVKWEARIPIDVVAAAKGAPDDAA